MSTPRAAFYYEDPRRIGRNDGAALYLSHNAKKLFGADNARHLLPDGKWDNLGKFDYHFWVDWGEDALMPHLPYKPVSPPHPNINITSDTHLGYDYRLSRARDFDWVFCNQVRAVYEFQRDGIPEDRLAWLPHAFEPDAYPKLDVLNRYDVAFIGNMNGWNRVGFLDTMFKAFPNFFFGKRLFEEAAEVYAASKVCLNISILDDINMRVFEVLGAGGFLLTNKLDNLDLLFKDGVHLVTYDNPQDAVEKARYYIEHEDERKAIAEAGHKEAMAKHTYMHRLKKVCDIVGIPYKEPAKEPAIAGGVK